MTKFETGVPAVAAGKRLDVYLVGVLENQFSREEIKHLIETSHVHLNGKLVKPRTLIKEGDRVTADIPVCLPREGKTLPKAEAIELWVIYEDDVFLVVDKPAGMVVHPGAGNKSGTLVNALLGRNTVLSSMGSGSRPGIVHRLDKETSGLLVVAKTNRAHWKLQTQFAERTLSKTYTALVRGNVEFEEGTIDKPIGRHPKILKKMAVTPLEKGREALTRYRVLKRYRHTTLLEIKPLSGRTHQIRVHLAHLGHPVVGDAVYGNQSAENRVGSRPATEPVGSRHALHASKLEFIHPENGKLVQFESPLPDDFKQLIRKADSE